MPGTALDAGDSEMDNIHKALAFEERNSNGKTQALDK